MYIKTAASIDLGRNQNRSPLSSSMEKSITQSNFGLNFIYLPAIETSENRKYDVNCSERRRRRRIWRRRMFPRERKWRCQRRFSWRMRLWRNRAFRIFLRRNRWQEPDLCFRRRWYRWPGRSRTAPPLRLRRRCPPSFSMLRLG